MSAIIKHNVSFGEISPVKVCKRALGISHILIADDTMLFFQASRVDENVKLSLDLYGSETGQSLTFHKCSILFCTPFVFIYSAY